MTPDEVKANFDEIVMARKEFRLNTQATIFSNTLGLLEVKFLDVQAGVYNFVFNTVGSKDWDCPQDSYKIMASINILTKSNGVEKQVQNF